MIREIKVQDYYGLMKLYTQLHNNAMPENKKECNLLWEQIMDDNNHHIIVAEEDDQIVASCVCVIVPNLTHNQRPYALVENVITEEAYRHRGLASECMEYARKIAKKENCYKIMFLTGAKENGILHFYEKAGYNKEDKTAFIQWL